MKMTIIYLLMIFIVAAVINLFHLMSQAHKQKEIRSALQIIKTLRQLIENIPKHRGMANALLQGDESFRSKLDPLKKEISTTFLHLKNHCTNLASANISNTVDDSIVKWNYIADKFYSLSPAKSFELHSDLIENVLFLMEDIARDFDLDNKNNSYINLLTQKLPLLTETLGQARGIGTGVAAKQTCDVATRVKLKFLHSRIKEIILNQSNLLDKNDPHIFKTINQSQGKTKIFLDMLHNELIASRQISIKSDEYYSQATEAIASNFTLFDELLPITELSTNQSLNKSMIHTKLQQFFSSSVIIASSIALLSLTTNFSG